MSFMYESMKSRGPGKRKIKLQEQNLLQLMQQEDDDDEDDDFELSQNITSDLDDDSDQSSDDSSSSSNISSSSDSLEDKPLVNLNVTSIKDSKHKKQHTFSPTIGTTNEFIKSQKDGIAGPTLEVISKAKRQFDLSSAAVNKKLNTVFELKICCICLKDTAPTDIIHCNKCGIHLHKDCYGELTNIKNSDEQEQWFCSRCVNSTLPACEFCPSTDGCIKETTTGQWCHVVCARYILGKDMFKNNIRKGLIGVTSLNYKRFGLHECILCEDRIMSKSGICVKCDAGLCRSFFHVTCAQKYGLLSENETDQNLDTDPYFVYCPLHIEKEKMARMQKLFLTTVAVLKQKRGNFAYNENLLRTRQVAYAKSQQLRFPTRTQVGEPPSRLLSSNPSALRMLNKKAELMFGIDVHNPALYFPKPSDVRKRQHVAPALSGEFVSHYVDRELRLVETRERIQNLMRENEKMIDDQKDLERKYELLQGKLAAAQVQEKDVVAEVASLRKTYMKLKIWANDNTHDSKQKWNFISMKPEVTSLNSVNTTRQATTKRQGSSDNCLNIPSKSLPSPLPNNLLKQCAVCKSGKRQHQLINCDVCKRWLHLSCLDPPLAYMPRKSKFSLWQCSDCAPSSGNDSNEEDAQRGSLITSEGRRQTSRTHKPPKKFLFSMVGSQKGRKNLKTRQVGLLLEKSRIIKKRQNKLKSSQSSCVDTNYNQALTARLPPQSTTLSKTHVEEKPNTSSLFPLKQLVERITRTISTGSLPLQSKVVSKKKPMLSKTIKLPFSAVFAGSHVPIKPFAPNSTLLPIGGVSMTKLDTSLSDNKVSHPPALSESISKSSSSRQISQVSQKEKKRSFARLQCSQISLTEDCRTSLHQDSLQTVSSGENLLTVTTKSNYSKTSLHQSSSQSVVPSKSLLTVTTKSDNSSLTSPKKKISKNVLFSKKASSFPLPVCCVCSGDVDMDKMTFCNCCKNHYHIWCCNPPLSARPRWSKFFEWECSGCRKTGTSHDADGGTKTTSDGRRKITRARKPPEKFANIFYSSAQQKLMKAVLGRRKKDEKAKTKEVIKKPRRSSSKRSKTQSKENKSTEDIASQTISEKLEKKISSSEQLLSTLSPTNQSNIDITSIEEKPKIPLAPALSSVDLTTLPSVTSIDFAPAANSSFSAVNNSPSQDLVTVLLPGPSLEKCVMAPAALISDAKPDISNTNTYCRDNQMRTDSVDPGIMILSEQSITERSDTLYN